VQRVWQKPHLANLTGSPQAYAPAGSLRRRHREPMQDYEAWSPE
jgi:NADH:ubiquinone oxidoreductase subunit